MCLPEIICENFPWLSRPWDDARKCLQCSKLYANMYAYSIGPVRCCCTRTLVRVFRLLLASASASLHTTPRCCNNFQPLMHIIRPTTLYALASISYAHMLSV